MTLRLYLMRHGETEWSKSGKHTGRADIPLTANGEDEARQLGDQIRSIVFDHVLASPLQRARQTCELAGCGEHSKIEPDLIEWDNGGYEGHTHADVFKQSPDWNLFRDGCPGGEMPAQISARADRLIERLISTRWQRRPVRTQPHRASAGGKMDRIVRSNRRASNTQHRVAERAMLPAQKP